MLATFGDEAPAVSCGFNPTPPPAPTGDGTNTLDQIQAIREYLFCALRERFLGEVATIQEAADDLVRTCNSTVATTMTALAEANAQAQEERVAAQAAAEASEAQIAAHAATIAQLEQQVRLLHCPLPIMAHTVVTTGDTAYGGAGLTVECSPGHRDATAGNRPFKLRGWHDHAGPHHVVFVDPTSAMRGDR